MRKAIALAGSAAVAVSVVLGVSACGSSPATVTAKFKCTQPAMGTKYTAYCVEDSNQTIFYYPWIYWHVLRLGTLETNGSRISQYAGNVGYQPASGIDVPPRYRPAYTSNDEQVHTSNEGGNEGSHHSGTTGGGEGEHFSVHVSGGEK